MEKDFDFSGQEVPEEIVDAFVDSIIVHKDYFEWNLKLAEKPVCCNVEGNKRKSIVISTEQSFVSDAQHRLFWTTDRRNYIYESIRIFNWI